MTRGFIQGKFLGAIAGSGHRLAPSSPRPPPSSFRRKQIEQSFEERASALSESLDDREVVRTRHDDARARAMRPMLGKQLRLAPKFGRLLGADRRDYRHRS